METVGEASGVLSLDGGVDGGDGGPAFTADRIIAVEDIAALEGHGYQVRAGIDAAHFGAFLAEAAQASSIDVYLTLGPGYNSSFPVVLQVHTADSEARATFTQDGAHPQASFLTVTGALVQVSDDGGVGRVGSFVTLTRLDSETLFELQGSGSVPPTEGMCGLILGALDLAKRGVRSPDLNGDGYIDEELLRDFWSDSGDPDAPWGTRRGLLDPEIVTGHLANGLEQRTDGWEQAYVDADQSCETIMDMCLDVRTRLGRGEAVAFTFTGRMPRRPLFIFRRWDKFSHIEPAESATYTAGQEFGYPFCRCEITLIDTADQDSPFGSFEHVAYRRRPGRGASRERNRGVIERLNFQTSAEWLAIRGGSVFLAVDLHQMAYAAFY